jgi:peptidyl-prolyl cis-trans isomerase C
MDIRVNDVIIPQSKVLAEMQYHPAPSREEAKKRAATALVIRELLCQEAERCGIDVPVREGQDLDEARIDALLKVALPTVVADEATCRSFYEANRERFRSPSLFEASHILIAPTQDNPEPASLDSAHAKAESLVAELQTEPAQFEKLAAAHSDCPSKEHNGRLGQIRPGDMVEEFETALAGMEEGEISAAPVQSRYGFHVIRMDHRADGRDLPFEHVHERIADYLHETGYLATVSRYLRGLADAASIEGIELERDDF